MIRSFRFFLVLLSILLIAHRSPAPIVEEEKPTPAPEKAARPKPKPVPASTTDHATTSSRATPAPVPRLAKKFAGTWTGIMHTFPWGDITETITVDPTETKITLATSRDSGSRTARAERNGDTLKGDFSLWGIYSLTPLADGTTALVRLQAPFNDNTVSFHRTNSSLATAKPSR